MKRKYVHREPLTSDLIFKAVFGQDKPECKAALIELLNLVLDRGDDPIVDLTYLNPFSIAEAEKEKTIIMDIKVTTSSRELIDIEMQIEQLETYPNRSMFYGCKQLTKGLERGEDYGTMKKSIVISLSRPDCFRRRCRCTRCLRCERERQESSCRRFWSCILSSWGRSMEEQGAGRAEPAGAAGGIYEMHGRRE